MSKCGRAQHPEPALARDPAPTKPRGLPAKSNVKTQPAVAPHNRIRRPALQARAQRYCALSSEIATESKTDRPRTTVSVPLSF